MIDEILEPVLNNKGEPCWLTRHYEQQSTIPHDIPIMEIMKENRPLIELPVFNLRPQGLWSCMKCGAEIQSNPNQPFECDKDKGGCGRTSTFKPVTKIINRDFWKIPIWKDLEPGNTFEDINKLIRKTIIFSEEIQYKIYNLDIHSSYFMDEWETIGYFAFIGMIESGKSRGLDLIAELGWRMINAGSGISFPAMVRGAHLYGAGILIDEAQDKLTHKTEQGQQMIDFLKPGYRRGSHYVIADKEDPEKIISYNNFGFKGFAAEREFDRAMMSRCKVFEMEQDYPEITNLKEIRDDLNALQNRILNLKYKRNEKIPLLPSQIELTGRTLEIFEPTIRTAMFLGVPYYDIIEYAKQRKQEEIESLKNSDEYLVLSAIKGGEENQKLFDAPEELLYSEIIDRLGWETDGKQNQRLGYILKKLHLKTRKKREGTVLLLNDPKNDRKLKYLYRRYKV